jgi:hypothetical protein
VEAVKDSRARRRSCTPASMGAVMCTAPRVLGRKETSLPPKVQEHEQGRDIQAGGRASRKAGAAGRALP